MLKFEYGTYAYYYFYKTGKKTRIVRNVNRYGRHLLGSAKGFPDRFPPDKSKPSSN